MEQPGSKAARYRSAELGQVALGVMLPQVDGQVGDPARVRLVMAQRAGSLRPADPCHDLDRRGLYQRAHSQGPPPAALLAVCGVGVDLRGRLLQSVPGGVQGDVDRAQTAQRSQVRPPPGSGRSSRPDSIAAAKAAATSLIIVIP
jgi:hypothetical protein